MTATDNYSPKNALRREVVAARQLPDARWDKAPLKKVKLSDLHATEEAVKSKHIAKILAGEKLRSGYDPKVVVGQDGKMYVADGNTRIAMHKALGKDEINVRVIDMRASKIKVKTRAFIDHLKEPLYPEGTEFIASAAETDNFACYDKSCAPPPVGKGGTSKSHSQAHRHAVRIIQSAKKVERTITADIQAVAEANGGSMTGLDNRLKGISSLRRKIHDKAVAKGIPIDDSASKITDAIRYTAVIPTANYTKAVSDTITSLKAKGYEVFDVENHWSRGDAYNGLHLLARHKNGDVAELQFHTPESIEAKSKIHGYYEEYRLLDTPPNKKLQLFTEMVKISDTAPVPVGVEPIGLKIERPHAA